MSALQASIAERIDALDVSLFSAIESQSSLNDRRSLLACQAALCERLDGYDYLEIGSHLGGSIQPHLLDTRCRSIVSIDKRPAQQPDARGPSFRYPDNRSERMLEQLAVLDDAAVAKVTCVDGDTRTLDPQQITQRPQLCFIDGEHTDEAALSDFQFCRGSMSQAGMLIFHDSHVVYQAIAEVLSQLHTEQTIFHAYNLPDSVFVVEFGKLEFHRADGISELLLSNHVGYLAALQANHFYRAFYQRRLFSWFRRLRASLSSSARR